MTTPVSKLDELSDNQASPYATVNEALRQLEGRTIRVLSRTTAAQPGSPADGDSYIIPASPTGTDWSTYAQHDIAQYIGGAWQNVIPEEGWNVWVNDADERVDFDGASWAAAAVGTASSIAMARIAGSTYSTVQDMQNAFSSVGVITGGFITDDADGTITVADGTGTIRATDSEVAELLYTDWPAESGTNVDLVDNDLNYVYAEYNAGTPRLIATITQRADFQTNVLLGTVYREGTTLHISNSKRRQITNVACAVTRRLLATEFAARESGAEISETGTRNIALTSGIFWEGLLRVVTAALDTSVADDFVYYYRDGAGSFNTVAAQTQIDNLQYDDGTGTLATLGTAKYGVHWIYFGEDNMFYVVYGIGSYSLTELKMLLPYKPSRSL